MSSSLLLGPPEGRHHHPLSSSSSDAVTGDDLIDLLNSSFNKNSPPMGLTENNSATYLSSGNPCLDFFFHVVPDTSASTVASLLSSAWAHDPLSALKLVCNLRGVRGTGKSDREGYYASALWLHSHHPKTLALNVASLAEFGYIKDLLEILYRLIHGPQVRQLAKEARAQRKPGRRSKRSKKQSHATKKERSKEDRIAAEISRMKIAEEKAAELRRSKRAELASMSVERYNRDPDYRFLHDRISDFFSAQLASDIDKFRSGEMNKIGLAAKWCPSIDSSFDRSTLLCESIAKKMFPRSSYPEYEKIEEEHYAYRVRDRLRKEILVPLRKALELPEVYISAGKWDSLPYERVASVAMKNYSKFFKKHDGERFSKYLEDVREGKRKIAAGALLPHQIVVSVEDPDTEDVAELQWQRMVKDMADKGKLRNCISVCDVSGSMYGTPANVCIALGLLISELSEKPWKGRVITFSATPQLHIVTGDTLKEKRMSVNMMDWGMDRTIMNTDFQKVFDQILRVAVEGKLEPEKMIKRLFVFSDMEFDEASPNSWETDYDVICTKFQRSGYGSCIPEIVFWNLRDSGSTPVASRQKGVALVSGFSKNIMKVFLEEDGTLDPEAVMADAVSGFSRGIQQMHRKASLVLEDYINPVVAFCAGNKVMELYRFQLGKILLQSFVHGMGIGFSFGFSQFLLFACKTLLLWYTALCKT